MIIDDELGDAMRNLAAPRRIGWVWPCPCRGFGVPAS